jgi:hypothetical protein
MKQQFKIKFDKFIRKRSAQEVNHRKRLTFTILKAHLRKRRQEKADD